MPPLCGCVPVVEEAAFVVMLAFIWVVFIGRFCLEPKRILSDISLGALSSMSDFLNSDLGSFLVDARSEA